MFILQKIWEFLIDTFQSILIAASIFLVIYVFLFRPFKVDGSSMFPNFQNEEYILTNLITLRLSPLVRGDIVVFKAPDAPEKDYIKRIIGLPGDSVSIHDGNVYVNNQQLSEKGYLADTVQTYGAGFLDEGNSVTVPADSYFVLGDNRPNSSDSRYWGFVKKEAIIGKSFYIYWPPSKMQFIKNPFTP